jgi:cell division protein FtsL
MKGKLHIIVLFTSWSKAVRFSFQNNNLSEPVTHSVYTHYILNSIILSVVMLSVLATKYKTRVEVTESDKHSYYNKNDLMQNVL